MTANQRYAEATMKREGAQQRATEKRQDAERAQQTLAAIELRQREGDGTVSAMQVVEARAEVERQTAMADAADRAEGQARHDEVTAAAEHLADKLSRVEFGSVESVQAAIRSAYKTMLTEAQRVFAARETLLRDAMAEVRAIQAPMTEEPPPVNAYNQFSTDGALRNDRFDTLRIWDTEHRVENFDILMNEARAEVHAEMGYRQG